MSVSRRRFLSSAAVLSAAVLLKPGTFVLGQDSTSPNFVNQTGTDPVHAYSREMFEPYVGDVFRVRVGKQVVDLKLVALTSIEPASRDITTGKIARTDCFSMRFHAAKPLPAASKIRNLSHGKLGDIDLFMVQSKKSFGFQHTAIVNHVV